MRPLVVAFAFTAIVAVAPAQDTTDPLPKGAVARLGTERMRNSDGYGITQLHPDGKRVISAVKGKPSLIDPLTGVVVGPFGKASGRNFVSLSADGSRAVATTFDGFIVYDTESGKAVYELKRPLGYDDSLKLSGDGKWLAVGGRADEKDKKKPVSVTVYDVENKKETASLKVAQNQNAKLVLSANGQRAVSWGYHFEQAKPGEEPDEEKNPSRLIQFWDVAGQKELGNGRLAAGYGIASVAITPAGDLCAASTGDGTVTLFDVGTGKKLKELLGRSGVGMNLNFSADGKTLASAAGNGAVQMWDVASGKSLGVAPPPVMYDYLTVESIVVESPTRAVALTRVGGCILVWEAPSGRILSPVVGHKQPVTGLLFTSANELVAAGLYGEVIRWDTTGKRVGELTLITPGATYATPQSARIIAPAGGGVLLRNDGGSALGVYDPKTGVQKFAVPSPIGGEPPVAFTADGKRMVVAVSTGYGAKSKTRLMVIDPVNGTKASEVTVGIGSVNAVAITPDGKTVGMFRTVSDDKGNTKTVFSGIDLESGKVLGESESKGLYAPRLAATPDNKTVIGNSPDNGSLVVYDLTTGKPAPFAGGKVAASAGPVLSVDGKRMAVSTDNFSGTPEIQVYDFAGGKKTHTFKGHIRGVASMAFSPDGKLLATGSFDTTVLVWDLSKEQ